ncbi:MAG TPA: hypothetical protein VG389_16735 [Myxococcota bacterium]|jgi:hypothetical protein|nr:hypothetical protein [Myxococcota bacterium]
MPAGPRKIGQLLIEIGALTNERLEEALRAQIESGGKIGRILVDRKLVSEVDLARALALQTGAVAPSLDGGESESEGEAEVAGAGGGGAGGAGERAGDEAWDAHLRRAGDGDSLDADDAFGAPLAVDMPAGDAPRVAPGDVVGLLSARGLGRRTGPLAPAARGTAATGAAARGEDPQTALRDAARALLAKVPASAEVQVWAALVQAAVASGRFSLEDLLRALGVERGSST